MDTKPSKIYGILKQISMNQTDSFWKDIPIQ